MNETDFASFADDNRPHRPANTINKSFNHYSMTPCCSNGSLITR